MECGQAFIEMENVSVAQGDAVVLHGISLRLQAGEHVAILGPNGCGKSTLIDTLTCRKYPVVQAGSQLQIFGRERWDLMELRRHLGIVASELPGERTPRATGRDAVLSGFFASATVWPYQRVTPAMRERADAVIEQLGVTHLAEKRVGHMSAGEKKRILIGRALVHAPRVLLLDEPGNALDLAAQRELRATLSRLARQGIGILLVTHHLADIIPEIDRIVMMQAGRIVADGKKSELLTPRNLERLFGVPVDLAAHRGFYHAW